MVENTVDSTTGMVTVRGVMNNQNETLWPGTLVNTKLVFVPRIPSWCDGGGPAQPERQLRVRGEGWRGQGSAGEGRSYLPGHVRDR